MRTFICMIMVICVIPVFAQIIPSTLSTFKEKMLEKKEYAGVILHQSSQQIDPNDFMGDIEGLSTNWNIEFIGDTVRSCYTYVVNQDYVRFYMDINITTGNVISLQRNSSGTINWWTEIWKPTYTTKETYKSKKVKLPKRVMNEQEKRCLAMFERVIQIVNGTFSTGNVEADILIYKCFTKKKFVNGEKFGQWKSGIFNEIFYYQFTQRVVKDDKDGYYTISISLLDNKITEAFKYFTVRPMIETELPNGFEMKTNPAFDASKHIVYLSMSGELLPSLLEVFQ